MQKIVDRQGMGLVVLLVAAVIIGIMCVIALKSVNKNVDKNLGKPSIDQSNQKLMEDAGVNTSSYQGILDSTQEILKNAEASRDYNPLDQ